MLLAAVIAWSLLFTGIALASPVLDRPQGTAQLENKAGPQPAKPQRAMTLKERRAQVKRLRAPTSGRQVISGLTGDTISSLTGDTVVLSTKGDAQTHKAKPSADSAQKEQSHNAVAPAALPPVTGMTMTPRDTRNFPIEWGFPRWTYPAGAKAVHRALYRESDDVKVDESCFVPPDGNLGTDGGFMLYDAWGIITPGEKYYLKVAVASSATSTTDDWTCGTGWSSEVKSPSKAAEGPGLASVSLPSEETYGCTCADHTTGRAPVQGFLGDPVNTATSALNESAVDAEVSAPGVSFSLQRAYDSQNPNAGLLGKGWAFVYDIRLQIADAKVTYIAENGSRLSYAKGTSADSYRATSRGVTSKLSGSTSSGFTLTTLQGEKLKFDGSGKLAEWKDRTGSGLSFSYTDGDLSSITDAVGHTIKLTVDPASHLLTRADLPGGRSVGFDYTAGQLTSVKGTDGGTVLYGYTDGFLSSVTDNAGKVVMRTAYDTDGRVTQQTNAYGKTSKVLRSTQETDYEDANGGIWTDVYKGSLLVSRIDPPGNVTTFHYDSSLRLRDAVDAGGNHTTLSYDARGNLLARAEGV
ncbi:MAG: RHS repeat protein [Streptomyces sp.]|nr:RHS repeat protein [Streptomyces sp.]